jgi:ATP-dependent Zn protease
MEEITYPKEDLQNESDNNSSSEIEKYYSLINKNLERDLLYTTIVAWVSWLFIIGLLFIFFKIMDDVRSFWSDYLASIKNGSKNIPPDKVVVTFLSINSAKLAGIVGILAKFFSKKFNNNSIIKV